MQRTQDVEPQRLSHWPTWPDPVDLGLDVSPGGTCPYLPDRSMQVRAFRCHSVASPTYQLLLDAGFRRAGDVYYQPACAGCRACIPVRVRVDQFVPSRSQRRCRRKNDDLRITVGEPSPTDEKHQLYQRYIQARHDGTQSTQWDELVSFLYRSSTETVEVVCRDASDQLLGVGICDLTPHSVSSVYHYFDPADAHRSRSLGTFGSLVEIELARMSKRKYYYLGYWIAACGSMAYKNRFHPCERLDTDGVWRLLDARSLRDESHH